MGLEGFLLGLVSMPCFSFLVISSVLVFPFALSRSLTTTVQLSHGIFEEDSLLKLFERHPWFPIYNCIFFSSHTEVIFFFNLVFSFT